MASTNIQTFPGKVGVSNTNPVHTLDIGSNVYIDDTADTKLRIVGNIHASGITVDGTITTIETENLSVKDPIILLASESTGTSDTGIIMKRADGDSNVAIFYDEGVGLKIGHTLSTAEDIHLTVDSSAQLSTSIYGPVTVADSSTQALTVDGGAYVTTDFKVGASKLFVDVSESSVGIGTDAPLATLDVRGSANVGMLTATSISSSSNLEVGTANLFVDTTTSNVGIGTDAPAYELDVVGNVYANYLIGDGSAISAIQSSNVSDFASNVSRIGTLETDLGSNVTRITNLETDLGSNVTRIGTLETDLGSNVTRITNLETDLGSNVTRIGNLESGDLTIDGEKTFSSNLEVGTANLFVDTTTGNVGVGVTEPGGPLDVVASSEGDYIARFKNESTASDQDARIVIEASDGGGESQILLQTTDESTTHKWNITAGSGITPMLEFQYNSDFNGGTRAMAIKHGGNVVVGGSTDDWGPFTAYGGPLHDGGGIFSSKTCATLDVDRGGGSVPNDTETGAIFEFRHTGDYRYVTIESVSEANSSADIGLRFKTVDTSAGPEERMRINSHGNVGIGTVSPTSKLHVFGGALTADTDIATFHYTNGNQSYLKIKQVKHTPDATDWNGWSTRIQQVTDVTNQSYIEFNPLDGQYATAFGRGSSEYMRIKDGGNVGIGTGDPATRCDISLASGTSYSNTVALTIRNYSSDYTQIVNGFGSRIQFRTNRGGGSALAAAPSADIKGYVYTGAGGTAEYHALDLDVYGDNGSLNKGISILSQSSSGGPANTIMHGNVGINNTNPAYTLDVNGTIYSSGDVIMFSDERKKTNIETIPNALDKVLQLRGVTFDKLDDSGRRHSGVIAQEVEKVLPEVVYTAEDGTKSVAYGNMIGLLIEAIKELVGSPT
jgi:hypothetical protein